MAEKKRQCGTCRFFDESESGSNGKCTHPKRDKVLREMVLLRPNELGCRTKWGTSLWQDTADHSDPFAPETPQQPTLPDPIPAQLQYDDEVTSVSIAGSKSARPSFEDDVVDSGAVGSGMGSWSDSVQEERRRLLINSDRDAVAGARKRHLEKKAHQRELIPFAEDNTETNEPDKAEEKPAEPEESVAASKDDFPPADYVEEERSSEKDNPVYDDEMVDDGVRPGGNRSPRVRKLMRENKSPKSHKAMGLGTPAEMTVTSHNPEKREQWNSVPSMTPGFALPLLDTKLPNASAPLRVSASAAPMSITPVPTRPVSQARELVSEDRLRQERSRRHVSVPMAEERPRTKELEKPIPTVTNRPRLTEAPPQQSAPVDRLKSSPLRGYHPAVKAAAARAQEREEQRPARNQQPRESAAGNQPERTPRRAQSQPQINSAPEPKDRPLRRERDQERPSPQSAQVELTPRQIQPQEQNYAAREPRPERVSPDHQNQRPHARQEQRKPYIRMEPVKAETPFAGTQIEISPKVPRTCGTCASFLPSDVEGRGSCANQFAGPVQRVVNEQDLACQHTYGSFWLPADDEVWLDELNDHYPLTPRVDAMLTKRQKRKTVVLPDLEELTS